MTDLSNSRPWLLCSLGASHTPDALVHPFNAATRVKVNNPPAAPGLLEGFGVEGTEVRKVARTCRMITLMRWLLRLAADLISANPGMFSLCCFRCSYECSCKVQTAHLSLHEVGNAPAVPVSRPPPYWNHHLWDLTMNGRCLPRRKRLESGLGYRGWSLYDG